MKKKKIILVHPGGADITFDHDHAHRLMAKPDNGGWKWKNAKDAPVDEPPVDQVPEVVETPQEGPVNSSSSNQEGSVIGDSGNKGTKKKST